MTTKPYSLEELREWREKMGKGSQVFVKNLCDQLIETMELLEHAQCPVCDGGGIIAHQVGDDECEPQQCQWCYERDLLLLPPAPDMELPLATEGE